MLSLFLAIVVLISTGLGIWSFQKFLRDRYPSGYVLLIGQNEKTAVFPIFKHEFTPTANWNDIKIKLNLAAHEADVSIPEVKWPKKVVERGSLELQSGGKNLTRPYQVGTAIPVGFFIIAGEPQGYFEVINENPYFPLSVIGYKE